ncbi:MAG: glycosyltransferase family 2 protein [Bacteroidota bacterium]|nr:glycosyltransferase family 2 protein [Bacteroidota bacterium]
MNPKVSILVPVYNVSPFIEKCANSLFEQTFKDIEYIFVNDATPDDSMEKLQKVIFKYPERKDSIKIIHHATNRGLAATRNTALDASTGDFIAVVDSDDFIEPKMIEVLYNNALIENADIVVSDLLIEYPEKIKTVIEYIADNKEENFKNIIQHELISSSLCNKLINRDLYMKADCRVPENLNYCEDWHVMTRLFYFANKIVKVDRAFYHYIVYNSNSITRSKGRMHFENVVLFWSLLDSFLKEHNEFEKYKAAIERPKVQSKVNLMIDTNSSRLRKEFAGIFKEEEKHCLKYFKRGEKLMLLLVRYHLFFLAQLFHTYLVTKNTLKRKLSIS